MAAGHAAEALALPAFDPPARVLIVQAPYYSDIAGGLLAGARAVLDRAGALHETVSVPGALELPAAIRLASQDGRIEGFVALGCVIRGETTHYETVCNESARGLMALATDRGLCIGNGILTCENYEQAAVRADPADQDKGGGAAAAALHLIALARRFGPPAPPGLGRAAPQDEVLMAAAALSRTA